MKRIFFVLMLFSFVKVNAQSNFDSTSFNVSKSDLETNEYSQDSTANALVLYEYGNSYVDNNSFKLITKIKRKVKIFNKKGVTNANIEIYLYNSDNKNSKEKIKNIFAITLNLQNGKVTKTQLKKSEIFKEVYNKNYTIVKFTLPNIQIGSVISYSYTIESPFMYKYYGWKFQENIPKLYSEYNTSIPGNYDYNIKLVGSSKLIKNRKILKRDCLTVSNGGAADCTNSIYAMKDIPAFIEEDFMTSKNNYLSRIEYELKTFQSFDGIIKNYTKTWNTVDKELKTDPNIGKQLNKLSLTKNLIDITIKNETNQLIKASAIYKFVQENYKWNKEYKIFNKVSIKNLIKKKSGNISSINILLHNLLKENGVDVKIVLLSTRKNGFPTKIYPVISDFNYVIVQAMINGKEYLLDASDEFLPFGEISFKCLNKYGRLLDFKNGSRWIDIESNKDSMKQQQIILNISEEGTISGQINSRYTGYHALSEKKSYFSGSTNYLEDFENKYPFIDVIEHSVKSKEISDEKFQESFKIEINDLNFVENEIYLDPFFLKFFTKNPFQLQQRTYPIDFGYKDSYVYSFELNLNDYYEIKELPKNKKVNLPNNTGEFIFTTKVVDNKLTVVLKINFNEPIYDAQYYKYLKLFMSKIVDIQTKTLIVLKKK